MKGGRALAAANKSRHVEEGVLSRHVEEGVLSRHAEEDVLPRHVEERLLWAACFATGIPHLHLVLSTLM